MAGVHRWAFPRGSSLGLPERAPGWGCSGLDRSVCAVLLRRRCQSDSPMDDSVLASVVVKIWGVRADHARFRLAPVLYRWGPWCPFSLLWQIYVHPTWFLGFCVLAFAGGGDKGFPVRKLPIQSKLREAHPRAELRAPLLMDPI